MKDNKTEWIEKNINEIFIYDKEKVDKIETGNNLKKIRESLFIRKKDLKCINYNFYVKIENGYSSITRKNLYKILSEFYDIAFKMYCNIEHILLPEM